MKTTFTTLISTFVLLLTAMAPVTHATTITVTSTNDNGAGTLRAALAGASNGDTINFSVVTPAIITLTGGQLLVNKNVFITGPGPANLAVAGTTNGVFRVTPGTTATISSLTITNGSAGDPDPQDATPKGGGILNDHAILTVSNCALSVNTAGHGGAIYNDGRNSGIAMLVIVNSTLNYNLAFYEGGGIFNDASRNEPLLGGNATVQMRNCTLIGNHTGSFGIGGGIVNFGSAGIAILEIANCTISSNGALSAGGIDSEGGGQNSTNGGFGSVSVTIVNSTLSGNSGGVSAGGIRNLCQGGGSATLIVSNSVLSGNSAGTSGGGGINSNGGCCGGVNNNVPSIATVQIANSTLTGNSTGGSGGGVYNGGGTVAITNSTLNGNVAGGGGGIYNSGQTVSPGTLTIAHSTLSGNSAKNFGFTCGCGGGVANDGNAHSASLQIVQSTLGGNSADTIGGSIYNDGRSGGSAPLEIGSTVLNAGASGGTISNLSGTVTSLGYNLSSDGAGGDGTTGPGGLLNATGDIRNTNPLLDVLFDNGGPTLTHALLPSSPAINAGNPGFSSPPNFDQRGSGFARVVGGRIDIGAFEANPTDAVGDGIAISWRAQYFGGNGVATNSQSCALCDFDGTGQNNLFKYMAGLDPTNPASVFVLQIQNVNGQPTRKNLIFNPFATSRIYAVQSRTNLLSGVYTNLPSFSGPQTNGNQVTVTDLAATQTSKFYRVRISLP